MRENLTYSFPEAQHRAKQKLQSNTHLLPHQFRLQCREQVSLPKRSKTKVNQLLPYQEEHRVTVTDTQETFAWFLSWKNEG